MICKQLPGEPGNGNAGRLVNLRLPIRLVCLLAAVVCLFPVNGKYALIVVVPALSPYAAVNSFLALRSFHPLMILGFVTGIFAFFKYRFFCRWICPLGTCLDSASWIGKSLNRKPCQSKSTGQWLAAITVGGAALASPVFLWLDPLSLFTGMFMPIKDHRSIASFASLIIIILLLLLSLVKPHAWCRGLCPLGGLQNLLAIANRSIRKQRQHTSTGKSFLSYRVARRTVIGIAIGIASGFVFRVVTKNSSSRLRPPGAADESTFTLLCTRCGGCIRACPHNIIVRTNKTDSLAGIFTPELEFETDYCRQDCVLCTHVCPSGALSPITREQKPQIQIGLPRVDMTICLLGEDGECSACMRFCPYNAVRYVFSEKTYSLAPVIDPEKCNGCGACQVACPTKPRKAIKIYPFARGDRKLRRVIGRSKAAALPKDF